ncbi:hypothetical protein ACQP2F_39295 [Actinoplanes sp. CA-030573]|uniref:hypothetical protein n=1 Tax=Actinoplanes sp. CA-030573 TaxID=3239898 RepID=UPI003D91C5B5
MRLYVARDRTATLIGRSDPRVPGHRVAHSSRALTEIRASEDPPPVEHSLPVVAGIWAPPALIVLVGSLYVGIVMAVALAVIALFTLGYAVPAIARSRPRKPRPPLAARSASPARRALSADPTGAGPQADPADSRVLTADAERAAFDRAVATADRIAETWPALGDLIETDAAESLLAESLWEIAGALERHQELAAVLADLTRPDFAAVSPADGTAERLRAHIRATKEALAALEVDLAAREASLRRAEEAGRTFIREQQMREAIKAAERSLNTAARPPFAAEAAPDPAAELAEHTQVVLSAYRELTASLTPDPHDR